MSFGLSKSKYVTFCRCKKLFWLELYKSELGVVDDTIKSRLAMGNKVGDLAMNLFGEFTDVTTILDSEKLDLIKMTKDTKDLIEKGYQNICEASFLDEGLYCAIDILHKVSNGYEVYEVKSATDIADYYYLDVAFQNYVLMKNGIDVTDSYLVTINSNYEKKGNINLNELFKITRITDDIKDLIDEVEKNINYAKEIYASECEPVISISKNCVKPFKCIFYDYCFKNIPQNNIFELANNRKKYDYYHEGIITFEDLLNSKYYNKLTFKNKMQIEYALSDKGIYTNDIEIKKFLDKLIYPLYFLDFESIQQIIPSYDGIKPYEQIPFQYSLHFLETKEGILKHKEFLAKEGEDPRYALAKQLCQDIGQEGTIIAYNMSFEKSIIKNLSYKFLDLHKKLQSFDKMFVDLMEPFKDYYIYMKDFHGSYSIKYILPALFPNDKDLNYKNLEVIHNGNDAMSQYAKLEEYDTKEREIIKKALLKYCELDTYAMVKILFKLYELNNHKI